MINLLLMVLSFISAIFLPWPVTIFVVLVTASFEPFVPFAIGLFVDTLYYAPSTGHVPLYTLCGLVTTGAVLLVRSRLRTDPLRRI